MKFEWNMTKERWSDLVKDHADKNRKVSDNVYGQVRIGNLSADILHTADKDDWYPFAYVFALGKDDDYATTESGVPYALLDDSPEVPIEAETFEEFREKFEKNFEDFINEAQETRTLANAPLGNWN
jgi:hypothetical protein